MKPPILIGGVARSGTTLLQMMLDAHPHLAIGIEISTRAPGACACLRYDDCESCRYFLDFTRAACGLPIDHIVYCYRLGESVCGADYASDMSARHRFTGIFFEALGMQMAVRARKQRWGFKVMHTLRDAPALLHIFPSVRLVHVVRDGLDVFASWKQQDDRFAKDPVAAAQTWAEVVGEWREEYGILVRYEQLVLAPRSAMERLLNDLDEPWSEEVLRHEQAHHLLYDVDFEQPSREQVKAPVHAQHVGRWRKDLTQQECDAWLAVAGDLRWKLGYV